MHSDLLVPGSLKKGRLKDESVLSSEKSYAMNELNYLIDAQSSILQLCGKKKAELTEAKIELEKNLQLVVEEISKKEKTSKMEKKEIGVENLQYKKEVQTLDKLMKKYEKMLKEKQLATNQREKTEQDLNKMEAANERASKDLGKLMKWERWADSFLKG